MKLNTHRACKLAAQTALLSTIFFANAFAQTSGAGSTLVRDLMSSWTAQHGAASGGARYEATGSSSGIEQAIDGTVDFGVTDVPLTSAALKQSNLRQMPLAGAAVVIIVNLPELNGKPLKLTGNILADIFTGSITTWNNNQIAGINPGLPLPSRAITPIWRSDGSGQSYVFSSYVARSNTKWRRTVGVGNNLVLSTGRSVRGGAAMVDAVKATSGSIGYDNLGSAQRAGLGIAELRNAADVFVAPNQASINEAMAQAKWSADNLAADLDATTGAGSYPMAAVAYALLSGNRKGGVSPVAFLKKAVASGDTQVTQAGFVALPASAKNLVGQMR